jgi:hypothetical protein
MPEQDEMDLLIHSALSSYADPGRESGLEKRILARIAEEDALVTGRRWLPWAIALPVAAGLLLLLMLSAHRQTVTPLAHHLQVPLAQQTEVANAGREPSTDHRLTRRESSGGGIRLLNSRGSIDTGKTELLPKREVFPTLQPLSPEERAIANFVARATETERQSFFEAQKRDDAPLSIAAIEIQPLDPPNQGGN